jgi:hypothetical protein
MAYMGDALWQKIWDMPEVLTKEERIRVWIAIARWGSLDWYMVEQLFKRHRPDQEKNMPSQALETWLERLYHLGDERIPNEQGMQPWEVASANEEWPYLLSFWVQRAEVLARALLRVSYGVEEVKKSKCL